MKAGSLLSANFAFLVEPSPVDLNELADFVEPKTPAAKLVSSDKLDDPPLIVRTTCLGSLNLQP